MKKLIVAMMAVMSMCFGACATEQVINIEQLPAEAQTVLKTHFAGDSVAYVMQDKDGLYTEYEVRFANGSKIEFDSKGALKKVDCGTRPVPAGLVPEAVHAYIKTKFPKAFISEWGKDDHRWKAELNNGLELEFNNKYKFLRIDD